MSPPTATVTTSELDSQKPLILTKGTNGTSTNGSSVTAYKVDEEISLENYQGDYRFAPIEEAEVSRAMIKR